MKIKSFNIYKTMLLVFTPLVMALIMSAGKPIQSSVYEWNDLAVKKNSNGSVRNILKGPTRSLNMFEIKAITLDRGKAVNEYTISKGFDELLILKTGSASVTVNGENKVLDEGSIVVASQGDRIQIKNSGNNPLTYYSFLFNPKSEGNQPVMSKVSPLFREWTALEFKPGANGGRRDVMKQPTSALKELEIHVTTLKEGLPSHAAHSHPDEEIILVRFGRVEETISGKPFQLGPGSVIFLTNDDMHGISNAGTGQCEYYAIRWLTY